MRVKIYVVNILKFLQEWLVDRRHNTTTDGFMLREKCHSARNALSHSGTISYILQTIQCGICMCAFYVWYMYRSKCWRRETVKTQQQQKIKLKVFMFSFWWWFVWRFYLKMKKTAFEYFATAETERSMREAIPTGPIATVNMNISS